MLAACVMYGSLLVFVYCALRWAADLHWWGTVLQYTPRWILLVPLVPLAAACGVLRRWRWVRWLGVLVVLDCLVLNVEIPWRRLMPEPTPRQTLRLLTCNCDYGRLKVEELRRLIAEFQPDLVLLQSIKPHDFAELFSPEDWYVKSDWRLGLASHYPIGTSEMLDRPELAHADVSLDDFRRYELDVDGETLHLANVHMASPRVGLWAVMREFWDGAPELEQRTRMRQLEAAAIQDWMAPYPAGIIAGDFNMPLESPTFRDYFGGYLEAFSAAGWGIGNTFEPVWWQGLRIDHVLAGEGWWCRRCWVGPYVGAEHRPVLTELAR